MSDDEKYADIARRLREFGYPDLTTEKIRDYATGVKKSLVIESFIKSMLPDYDDAKPRTRARGKRKS